MDEQISVRLDGRDHIVPRARLGLYLSLQGKILRLAEVSKKQDGGGMANVLFEYLSLCIPDLDRGVFNALPWYEIVGAFSHIVALNALKEGFAIMRTGGRELTVPWDHPERTRVVWVNILATAYHWSKDDIENLRPEEAIGHIQEIIVNTQEEREFAHSLSQVAYSYDPGSKRTKYVPLHKPPWMVLRDPDSVKTRIPKENVPLGKIIYPGDKEDEEETLH
jgi:hypothetical protein